MKTKKAIAKKFKVTASGKLKFRHPGKRHKLTHKASKRKRQLGQPAVLSESQAKTYKMLIGVNI
jgi:large subunit ribosomal protein L35